MSNRLNYPFDATYLLRKKKSIRNGLLLQTEFLEKRVAILGGSTTAEVKDMMELFLLNDGIKPIFYESDYNRYFEDIIFSNSALKEFAPDILYIHTSSINVTRYPRISENSVDIQGLIANEMDRFKSIWDRIADEYACPIIQNNFELPHYRSLGNMDCYDIHGRSYFISKLNLLFSEEAQIRPNLYLNDINYLSGWFGLERWYDKHFWYSYKYAMSLEAIPLLADSVASIIKAVFGKTKKCLVLDLDNTLWGGIIGDDGLGGIQIGRETAEAEAYSEFQEYVKMLKERGVILAICSKNDETVAREGFTHPNSILKLNDFSEFRANWESKNKNIHDISTELKIGIDSIVFVDDNPVERDIVRSQEPEVTVPELGNNVTKYIDILDKTGFFETISLSKDDLKRNDYYKGNSIRNEFQNKFNNYDEFLKSLNMVAEIKSFESIYLDRITQLTNKTNQFNLTTKRYTFGEIESICNDDNYIKLYGRLDDKFGDNGLVSIVIGNVQGRELHINLWLMSCRVLKRGMEVAMLDRLVEEAMVKNVNALIGYYYTTSKNSMVSGLFKEIGFENVEMKSNSDSVWRLDITDGYENRNKIIQVNK